MAVEASVTGRRFTIAGVVDRMVAVFAGQGWLMLGLAVLFGGLPRAGYEAATMSAFGRGGVNGIGAAGADGGAPFAVFSTPSFWIALAVFWLAGLLASGSMTTVAIAAIERRPVSFGGSVGVAIRKALPLVLMSIVSGLAIFVGILLFIIPGIMLMIIWSVAWPAMIVEDEGPIGALERSAYLTNGARWLILAILVIGALMGGVISSVDGASSVALSGGAGVRDVSIVPLIAGMIATTLTILFSTALTAAMYTELKAWKEGEGGGELGEIFA